MKSNPLYDIFVNHPVRLAKGRIDELKSEDAEIDELKSEDAEIESLDTEKASIEERLTYPALEWNVPDNVPYQDDGLHKSIFPLPAGDWKVANIYVSWSSAHTSRGMSFRLNDDTDANYDYLRTDGSKVTGDSRFDITPKGSGGETDNGTAVITLQRRDSQVTYVDFSISHAADGHEFSDVQAVTGYYNGDAGGGSILVRTGRDQNMDATWWMATTEAEQL